MARPTVLLWDVDGTLVTTNGAGRRALERAFEVHCGRRDATEGLRFGGMTDRAIARYGLTRIGWDVGEAAIDALLDTYLEVLGDEIRAARGYAALPGVVQAVHAFLERPDYAVGLGTGNLRIGAEIKLRRVDLDRAFSFGGFGCDHEDRAELIRIGAERGAARLGVPRSACRVVVIGDTPKDVAAARAIGAECLAVATGGASHAELLESRADRTVRDLTDADVIAFLAG